jgi:hypothetical protein
MIQYTVNTTKFRCLFRYMFRPARAVLVLQNCVKAHTKVDIYIYIYMCVCVCVCVCVFVMKNLLTEMNT